MIFYEEDPIDVYYTSRFILSILMITEIHPNLHPYIKNM